MTFHLMCVHIMFSSVRLLSGHLLGKSTGTRSKIFNEIVFKDNHLLALHEKCIHVHNYKKRHGNAAKLHPPSKIRLTFEIHGCFISKRVIIHYPSPECS